MKRAVIFAAATAIAGHILPAPSVRVRTPQIIALADSTDDAEFLPADIILANQRSARHTARELAAAVSREDYASAAKLKEELALLHAADPIHTLRAELADALSREEYDAAASTQQQLARLRETRPGILWRDEVLVLGAEGKSLHLLPGDGSGGGRVLYKAAAGATLQQPVWSPDAEQIAVSEIIPGGSSRVLVLNVRDGSEHCSAPTPPVFFLYFAPANDVVTFLHAEPNVQPNGPTLVLGAIDLTTRRAKYVAPGGPLFYALSKTKGQIVMNNGFLNEVSFSPDLLKQHEDMRSVQGGADDGAEIVAEGDRLVPKALCKRPAAFRTPCLLGNKAAAYVEDDGTLVAVDVATSERIVLHKLGKGDFLLMPSPDGCAVLVLHSRAVDASAAGEDAVPKGKQWVEQQLVLVQADDLEDMLAHEARGSGPLGLGNKANYAAPRRRVVHDLPTSELGGAPSANLCCFWSPDSRKVLCLETPLQPRRSKKERMAEDGGFEQSASGQAAAEEREGMKVAWGVWELNKVEDGAKPPSRTAFEMWDPSEHFLRSIVPFFDQCARGRQRERDT